MKTADKIILEDLIVLGRVGHTPEERAHPQKIWVDLELETDTHRAARSDDIRDAVNYLEVAAKVQEILDRGPYNLAERVAQEIARTLLSCFSVRRVTVRVKKKTVPNATFAIIQITRVKRGQTPSLRDGKV